VLISLGTFPGVTYAAVESGVDLLVADVSQYRAASSRLST
jgi:hypothetical protein